MHAYPEGATEKSFYEVAITDIRVPPFYALLAKDNHT
jgi:hypothetical protein